MLRSPVARSKLKRHGLRSPLAKTSGAAPGARGSIRSSLPSRDPSFCALPEIWAYGLRNPWRFSFDRKTGDLWIADVGQNQIEEINLAAGNPPGLNYGWNPTEGTQCYLEAGCDTSAFTLPVMEYTHDEGGCSVTGGYVYRGEEMPDLQGDYIFADYCSGFLWIGSPDDGETWTMSAPLETGLGIAAFGEDADGNLYIADLHGGGVYLLVPAF